MAEKQKVILEVEAKTTEANKSLEKVKTTTKDTSNAATDAAQQFSIMGVSIGGIKAAFAKVTPIAKAMFTTIKGGIAATGIGALLVAFLALRQYFTDNEQGAAKLKTILAGIGVVTGNITDVLSDLGKRMFEAFSNPKQAIIDLKDAIVENVENRIQGMIQSFGALGKVIGGVFEGDLGTIKEGMKEFGESQLQVLTGVEDVTSKIKKNVGDFVKQTKEEVGIATQLEKDRLALQMFERKALVDKAKTEAEIMKLRLQARDVEEFTNAERLAFMREANKLADEQLKKDLHVAEEKLRFQQVENSFSKSSQENLDAEAQLEAAVFQIQRSNFSERKRMKSEEQALVREAAALEKAIQKEKDDAEKKAREEKKKADEEAKKLKEEADKKEIEQAKAVAKAKEEITMNALNAIKGALGEESRAGKAIAVVQSTLDTYKGISAALGSAPPPFNFIAAATTAAAGFANVNKIMGTQEPKLNRGGIIGGMGTGTSDSVSARLSKGESVINARSTRMFKPILSAINEAGGGRSFAAGDGSSGTTLGAIKAFVVADDMTKQQDKLSKIRRKATI